MPARRVVFAAPALALAVSLAAPLPALAAPTPAPTPGNAPGPLPEPRAVTADGRPAKVADVLEHCEKNQSGCRFLIDRALGIEFATTVRSLGNAVVNCTQDPMNIERTVTLHAGTTDNISGEISGSVTAEGTIGASGEVTTTLSNDITSSHKTPDLSKGPTSESGTKTTVGADAKLAGQTSARLAFEAAFKAAYAKTWTVDSTESTTYKTTVRAHDMLVFGATVAMRRIVGQLVTNGGGSVLNVAVDSPSMVNDSHFVAQTYAAPAGLCSGTRPPEATTPDENNTGDNNTGGGPGGLRNGTPREIPARTAVPPGAAPQRQVVLSPAAS
ncbi:hypothetical protein [Streptomyces sp. Amel2xC10]|uniref:hypothetical protein n=1 Tax=Streptomyces sp. Amel2xC10 TaxID=1305826 RepID=UPI000A083D33|nr:hypothetical protein [Streptomyces sp. Amel2xC10]SME88734.1 hypothetical protein SAMN02745830_00128 [Streptomyces sp. Amel2xC10]